MLQEQLWVGEEAFDPTRWQSVKNANFVKPSGGLWTSTHLGSGRSGWTDFCDAEDFLDHRRLQKWILTPRSDARIYRIDDLDDLKALYERFQSYRAYGLSFGDLLLDYVDLARAYDIIHLTEAGQWRTRMTEPNLYGWDCESSLWLNPVWSSFCLLEETSSDNVRQPDSARGEHPPR